MRDVAGNEKSPSLLATCYLSDMAENPTTGELVRAKEVTSSDVETLLDAYLAAPTSNPLPLGPDRRVNVEAAIHAHRAAAITHPSGLS